MVAELMSAGGIFPPLWGFSCFFVYLWLVVVVAVVVAVIVIVIVMLQARRAPDPPLGRPGAARSPCRASAVVNLHTYVAPLRRNIYAVCDTAGFSPKTYRGKRFGFSWGTTPS